MSDVFISYSRKDAQFVGALADGLRARGKDVWIDIEGIRDAEVFPEALRAAIGGADGFVFVISPDSVHSGYCAREVNDAVETGKRIVPVDLKHVPDDEVPEPIRVRNWIPVDDIEATIERVVKALDTDLDHLRAHTHWELKAIEWDGKDREGSLLLHGADLGEAEAWLAGAEARDPPPTPLQREYLTASRQAAAKRQRTVATVAVAVAAISILLLVFALIQRAQATSAKNTDASRALALASEAQDSVDPTHAVSLAIQAAKIRPTQEALFALRSALDANLVQYRFPSFGAQTCQQQSPAVSFSAAGYLAIGLCSGRINLYGPNHRLTQSILQPDSGAPLRFDHGGQLLAAAGARLIRLYDARTLNFVREMPVPGFPQRIVFSGDDRYLAATSADGTRSWVSVWDPRTGRLAMQRSSRAPADVLTPGSIGLGFVNGSNALAVGSLNGHVRILASEGGRVIRTLPGTQSPLIGTSRDGRYLAVAGFQSSGPDSREGVVTLWDTWTWQSPRVIAALPGLRPRRIVMSPDGTRVAVGWSDGSAGIYSLATGNQLARPIGPPKEVNDITWSPDSQAVAVSAADGSVRIWRAGGPERAYAELGARMDWDPPAVSAQTLTFVTPPNLVRTLDLSDLSPSTAWELPLPRNARYTYAWLSPLGDVAVLIRSDSLADVWNLETARRIMSLPALPGAVAAVSHDGQRMILLDGLHNELVDLATRQITPIRDDARNCRGDWSSVRFSPHDRIVVGGARCGEVLVWSGRSGRPLHRYDLPGQSSALAITRDGQTVADASPDGHITLINLDSGARRAIPDAPRGIFSLDFGAGDRLLAAGDVDGTVRMWSIPQDRLLRVLALQSPAWARFTPDGKTLVTSELTGAVRTFAPCPDCQNARALVADAQQLQASGR